jgi:hypothetical protein
VVNLTSASRAELACTEVIPGIPELKAMRRSRRSSWRTSPMSSRSGRIFDDDMLVNAHVYGAPAAHSPVLHLRRLPGGRLFDHYQASFERVWEQASADNAPGMLAQGERR